MAQRASGGPGSTAQGSTVQAAREQTSSVGHHAAQAGGSVAMTAAQQGRNVAAESGRQAHHLLDEATTQLRDRADEQQKRAASGLRTLGDQLQSMAGQGEQSPATDMVGRVSGAAQAADWLEHHEPGDVVNGVRDYARRHPGLFLAGAVVAGVLSGRMTRSLTGAGGQPDGNVSGAAPQGAAANSAPADGSAGPVIGAAPDGRADGNMHQPDAGSADANRGEVGR
jgi:hypothetical protein